MATVHTDIWTYRDATWDTAELVGYSVEAIDGSIGKVDETSNDVGAGYIVVDTGPWIFGKKVLLPAGVISRIDAGDETVFVNRTKDQIKNAPEFSEAYYRDETYRGDLGIYYGEGGAGWQGW
jgi:PRC-barrel domain protein